MHVCGAGRVPGETAYVGLDAGVGEVGAAGNGRGVAQDVAVEGVVAVATATRREGCKPAVRRRCGEGGDADA